MAELMKIYSWNMLFKNAEQERAFDFIEQSDFDIFCLQEVPEEFLARLKERFPNISYAVETARTFAGVRGVQYLVTLSRWPIAESTAIPLAPRAAPAHVRSEIFVRLMMALRLWGRGSGARHNLRTDIVLPDTRTVSVYNLHLPLKHPAWRVEEFEYSLAGRGLQSPTIVCGDFNIIESPHITILNWLLGGTFADAFFWKRERTAAEKRFAEHRLHNPLRSQSTHPTSYSQLDHILLSPDFTVKKARVIRDRHGSDHRPIFVEI